jgi:hypothetical protein
VVGIVMGNKVVKVFVLLCYITKVVIIVSFGFYLINNIETGAGQEIGTNKYLVSLLFLRFVAIREFCLLPTVGIRLYM